MSQIESTEEVFLCPNCKTELSGQFCAWCGQNQKGSNRFLLSILAESFEDIFAFDSRAAKTVFRLLLKPGALTKEYFRGRRARYVQPLRLYFITSLAFFFLLSIQNLINETDINITSDEGTIIIGGDMASKDDQSKEIKIGNIKESSKKIVTELDELSEDEKKELNENIDNLSQELELSFLSKENSEIVAEKFKSQIEKAATFAKQNPQAILDQMLELAPPIIFTLLPLFAFLLKIVYINTGRFYTEHLILAVHNHCFIYFALLLLSLLSFLPTIFISETIKYLILLWIPIYLFLSLKNTYEEGWVITFIKYTALGITYSMLFAFISLAAALIGIFTL